jgi:hypothetical protein
MKNLLKQFKQNGKITLVGLFAVTLIVALIWVAAILVSPAKAAAERYSAKTFILPYKGETAKTIVLEDRATANMINGTTGASAAATTWDSAEIAGARHAVSGDWTFAISAHSVNYIILKRYDVAPASIDKDTVYTTGNEPLLYNPNSGLAYTDTNPIMDNQVNVTTVTPSGG